MNVVSHLYGHAMRLGKALALCGFLATPVLGEPVVIAALGDSLTQGYGLAQGDGLVPQLEVWLQKAGIEVQLRNAGVSGDTTQGGKSRIDWTLTDDVDGLIIALGGNDALRGIDPAVSRENLATIIQTAQARDVTVLLVAISAPTNFGTGYKAAFDGIFGDLAQEFEVSLTPEIFAALRDVSPQDLGAVMQGDGIHPNVEGVRRIVAVLGPHVQELAEAAR